MAPISAKFVGNCTTVDKYAPDPDIAGPGVIVSFMLTGALTLGFSYVTLWLHRYEKNHDMIPRGLRLLTPSEIKDEDVVSFWIRVLETFVLALSDQQLVTGLLLLICAYGKYYFSSVQEGANNLWVAADIVCFSSVTHAATLLTLRGYFRRHRRLATSRVVIMYIIYILWAIIAGNILSPEKPTGSPKLPAPLKHFWHGATYIEAFGVMWIYLITYLPIFLSEHASKVRDTIVLTSHPKDSLGTYTQLRDKWSNGIQVRRRSTRTVNGKLPIWKRLNPYKRVRSFITRLALRFGDHYHHIETNWYRVMLWCLAELFFPWYTTSLIIGVVWMFGLGVMSLNIHQNGLAQQWSFGQLLPPFLVLLPVVTLVGSIAEARNPMPSEDVPVVEGVHNSIQLINVFDQHVDPLEKPSKVSRDFSGEKGNPFSHNTVQSKRPRSMSF